MIAGLVVLAQLAGELALISLVALVVAAALHRRTPRAGDIGPVRREVTFEPMPDDVPIIEPAPPAPQPDRIPEPV